MRSERQQTHFPRRGRNFELQIDAGKVNTFAGWRHVKVAVFDRRKRSEPTTAENWDERDLPAPAVRSVLAAVEKASQFGERCEQEAKRLELPAATALSVLGDGAEWLWNLATRNFPGADNVLDFLARSRAHR